MNITVVTPYDSSNFGAFLQAYCLKGWLTGQGHNVTHIPTRPADYVESLYFSRMPVSKKEKLIPAVYRRHLEFGKRKYELFRKAQEAFRITEDFSGTDLIILGSDEIWNVDKPVFHAPVFWGDMNVPVISYAASIGDSSPDAFRYCPDQLDQLRGLKRALVRDENTRRFVEKYTDLRADLVCDPTILWPTDSCEEECHDDYVSSHDCLLVYAYSVSKREKQELRKFARAKRLKIVTCCFYHGWSDHQVECGPLAFSDLIRKCRFFYTSSFHGTVFGMLNHANFVVSTDNPKTLHLIGQYGLEDRLLSKKEMSADGLAHIYARKGGYRTADREIAKWRRRSGQLLEEAIAGAADNCQEITPAVTTEPPGDGGLKAGPDRAESQNRTAAEKKPFDPLICYHNQCTGCFACRAVCRENAISIRTDRQGRRLPEIDPEKCVGCDACRKVCPQRNPSPLHLPMECYAARGSYFEGIEKSSSGGISAILAASFADSGNVVCGSAVIDGKAEHKVIRAKEDLPLLQGSKYVQSDISDVYDEIRSCLSQGKEVLFLGTPCQVDAMNRFFGKNKNYWAVDIICHGVPPMEYLKEHLARATEGGYYDRFRFRGSPDDFTLKIYDGEELLYSKSEIEDTYFYGFLNCLTYRENCYSCSYAKGSRAGDLTIGDFWGLDKETLKNKYDGNISVVLVNTEKGRELFERIRPQLVCEQRETAEAVRGNPQLRRPSLRHKDRVRFMRTYMDTGDFSRAISATGIEKTMKRMQFGRTRTGKVYVFLKKIWQRR